MKPKLIVLVLVLLLVGWGEYHFYGSHQTPKGQPSLLRFSANDLTPLKTAFNNSAGSIRILVMLSPT